MEAKAQKKYFKPILILQWEKIRNNGDKRYFESSKYEEIEQPRSYEALADLNFWAGP